MGAKSKHLKVNVQTVKQWKLKSLEIIKKCCTSLVKRLFDYMKNTSQIDVIFNYNTISNIFLEIQIQIYSNYLNIITENDAIFRVCVMQNVSDN